MEPNLGKNFTENSLIGEQEWTTKASFTPEEEDAIATLVVVVVGIIIAIVVLFSMGVFIDCRQQKHDSETKKKRLKLKMPPVPRRRNQGDDERSLASNMHQGAMDFGAMGMTGEAVV